MAVQVEIDMPEGFELWDYDGALVIAGVKMDKVRFETIKGGLPGKLRQKVVGWRTLGSSGPVFNRKEAEVWPNL